MTIEPIQHTVHQMGQLPTKAHMLRLRMTPSPAALLPQT